MGTTFVQLFREWILYAIWIALMSVIIGAVFIDTRLRGSKRVLKVNADLENSHFMQKKEIMKNDGFTYTSVKQLHKVEDGIPVYAEKRKQDIEVILKKPTHTLLIGTTGSGKTSAVISSTIEILGKTKTKPSMVITDPKGELYANHGASLEKQGYRVTIIDLADVYHSIRWNPFNDIWRKTDRIKNAKIEMKKGKYYFDNKVYLTATEAEDEKESTVSRLRDEIYVDLQDLIYTICPVENTMDSTWQKGARDLIFALALGFWEDVRDGYMPREKFNLYNLYMAISEYNRGECEELIAYFENRPQNSRTRGLSNTVLVSQDRTLTSYMGEINQYFNWFADTGIAALTSGNDIEFNDFDEAPNALFLKIPDEKENRYKLITLFMTQMYKALIEKSNDNVYEGKTRKQTLLRTVYFIMDEFGNMPKFHKIDKIVTVGRSRRIFLLPVIQDFNQIKKIYGEEIANVLRSNCNIQIFVGSNDENTRKAFSELCGKKKIKQVSYSENKEMSVSTSAQNVPLIYPNELEHLNDPDSGNFGNAIVSCLGNYPIRSKFTPFFRVRNIYGSEETKKERGRFIKFDEEIIKYDITKLTAFLQRERNLVQGENEEEEKQTQQVEQVQQVKDSTKEDNQKLKRTKAKKMLNDVNIMIDRLAGKLTSEQMDYLKNCEFRQMIVFLDRTADEAVEQGNLLLAGELEQIKVYILHRCFTTDEIKTMNQIFLGTKEA